MKTLLPCLISLLLWNTSCKQVNNTAPETDAASAETMEEVTPKESGPTIGEVVFSSKDGVMVHGDLYTTDKAAPMILLFHQAGSNARGEYGTIIPKLVEAGYNVLAIDQRSGGSRFGDSNRTIERLEDKKIGYCEAFPDMEHALDYTLGAGYTGPKVIWGSSYSAALALQLGNKRQKVVDGILAFSPATGGALKNCPPNPNLEHLKIPTLLLRPAKEMERESSKEQWALAKQYHHQTYIAPNSVHGSSMLVKDRAGDSADTTWPIVLSFLEKFK